MKNASRTKVREATDRGSTLFYHSRRPVDAGQTEGFHIPRAPGRTFTAPAAGTLPAAGAPSLSVGWTATLSVHRTIPIVLVSYQDFSQVSSALPLGGPENILGHWGIEQPLHLLAVPGLP